MASYTTIEDWRDVEDGYVADVTIRQTEADTAGCNYVKFDSGQFDSNRPIRSRSTT